MQTKSSKAHIPALDGVRAFAILPVVVVHTWAINPGKPLTNYIVSSGWVGVQLFFVLSGFLITRGLIAMKEAPRYYTTFYQKRFARIIPAYYAFLAFAFLVLPHFSHLIRAHISEWPWHVFYLSNFRSAQVGITVAAIDLTWSLSVEEQFYLVWPFVVRRLTRAHLARVCLAIIVLVPIARTVLELTGVLRGQWLTAMTLFRLDAFAFGAIIAAREDSLLALPRWIRGTAVAVVPLVVAFTVVGKFGNHAVAAITWGQSAVGFLCAVVIWQTLTDAPSFLSMRPLRYIGQISYGMYLYQYIANLVVGRLGLPVTGWVFVAEGFVADVLIASASYYLFEQPIQRWARTRIARSSLELPAPATQPA